MCINKWVSKQNTVYLHNGILFSLKKEENSGDFPGGSVVESPPCNAGDVGLIPAQGIKIPYTAEQLSPQPTATEAHAPWSPCFPTRESMHHIERSCMPQQINKGREFWHVLWHNTYEPWRHPVKLNKPITGQTLYSTYTRYLKKSKPQRQKAEYQLLGAGVGSWATKRTQSLYFTGQSPEDRWWWLVAEQCERV